ncbi:carbohydrate deacetylase [Cyathus striatus]|nr:carbohydrate deacetylase [Cyathus striatus]
MHSRIIQLPSILALASVASAQQLVWGQCGGQGWTGLTTCVSGNTCTYVNAWYSQCIPGAATGPTTSTTSRTSIQQLPTNTTTSSTPTATNGGTEIPYGTLVTGCTVPGTVAVTFDDGPYQWTSQLIDSLNSAGVKATFFMCGKLYGCIYDYADVVKKAYNSGHQVSAHTWSHQDLTDLSAADVTVQLTRLETAFKKILGVRPKWLRPPYGSSNTATLSTLKSLKYKVVTWNLDSGDWNGKTVTQSQAVFNALGSDPKIIPLEHDALQSTATQLGPWLITWAKSKGLKMVTLSECLGEPIPGGQYEVIGRAGTKDSTWVC